MDLKPYTNEARHELDITFMENKNTNYKIVLKRTALEKGINEIHAYKAMSHSPLIDFSIDREGVMMMLHRHSGNSLEELLKTPRAAARLSEHLDMILKSALLSLERLHSSGIWHGSIRPNKIIIDEDHTVQFVGFGNSSHLKDCMSHCMNCADYDKYTAPEVVLGGKVDGRLADIYSLGKSFMEILKTVDCLDLEAVHKIYEMSSVIPQRREIFLNTLTGK